MRTSERSQKMAGVLREVLPTLLVSYLNPDEHGIISIERVEVSGDLGIVKIFMVQLGSTNAYAGVLRKARRKICAEMCNRVPFRRAPQLRFVPLSSADTNA